MFEGPREDKASSRTRSETSSKQAEHLIGRNDGLSPYATTRDHLYTHGYIARTLEPRDTAQYLTRLLRMDEHLIQLTFTQEWPGAFIITHPVTNGPALPVDYVLQNYGTVVPQRIWSPGTRSDAQRYNNVSLNMPIFFLQNDRKTLGLLLVNAAAGDCMGLLNARAPALVGNPHTITIRIKVSVSENDYPIDFEQMLSASSGPVTANGLHKL